MSGRVPRCRAYKVARDNNLRVIPAHAKWDDRDHQENSRLSAEDAARIAREAAEAVLAEIQPTLAYLVSSMEEMRGVKRQQPFDGVDEASAKRKCSH